MNPWRWVDPRVREIGPEMIREYLQDRGWQEHEGSPTKLFRFHATDGMELLLHPSEDPQEWTMNLVYFLTTLSEWENRHPVEIVDEILSSRSWASNPSSHVTLPPH